MKAEKQKPKGNPRKPTPVGKPPAPAQPAAAAARSSCTTTPARKPVGVTVTPTTTSPPAGKPPAPAPPRRKLDPTVTPAELEQADWELVTLWNKPAQSGWRNKLQRLRVCTRKNWVKG